MNKFYKDEQHPWLVTVLNCREGRPFHHRIVVSWAIIAMPVAIFTWGNPIHIDSSKTVRSLSKYVTPFSIRWPWNLMSAITVTMETYCDS
jgi:hypothetical protein